MSKFIQLHILASYPPSNLNRDDLGRPKTAIMGGTQRLRISSQSLKRACRDSEIFNDALSDHIGIRTKEMGVQVYKALTSGLRLADILKGNEKVKESNPKVSENKAIKLAQDISKVFGETESSTAEKPLEGLRLKQLSHFSPEEISAIDALISKVAKSGAEPTDDDFKLLREYHTAVDIAMFGRMLASNPKYNTEAAVQVSHAITVHEVAVEDDYFTAVDDLNRGEEDMGAGHVGEAEFASGLFYIYVCIDFDLLKKNLSGNEELAKKALRAFIESAAKVAPTGKQSSFASRAYASYILAEKGTQQPRSLSVAFLQALHGKNLLVDAIEALKDTKTKMDAVYGKCSDGDCEMNAYAGKGALLDIQKFVAK